MVAVSIVIVNYNTFQLVFDCIKSILKHTAELEYEIIVVDNASEDGSPELIAKHFPDIVLIRSKNNLGFGKANNIGASRAKGLYLFFLNSDTVLLNNAIKIFHDYFNRSGQKLGCIGGLLLDQNMLVNGAGGKFPQLKSYLIDRIKILLNKLFADNTNRDHFEKGVDYVLGADMFMSRAVFFEAGTFDERFFMYYEESDLQLRIYKLGYLIKIIDGPQILHLEGKSSNPSIKRTIMVQSSALKYYKKNRPYWEYLSLRLFTFLDIFRLLFKKSYSFADCKVHFIFSLKKLSSI